MSGSTQEYEDALAGTLVGGLQALWKDFEEYKLAIAPTRPEMIRITTEFILFPISYANATALAGKQFRMQSALVVANELYIRDLTSAENTVDLSDCVLSPVEREDYQAEMRLNWSQACGDLFKPSYRVLLRVMVAKAVSRCDTDIMRGTRLSPDPKNKQTLMHIFRTWGTTFTERTLGPVSNNSPRHQMSISKSAAMLGGAFFFLSDRLR